MKQSIRKKMRYIEKYTARAVSVNDEEAMHQVWLGYKN